MRSYIGGALWQSGSRLWVDTPSLRERYTLFKTADSWQFDEREARHGGIEIVSSPVGIIFNKYNLNFGTQDLNSRL